MSPLLPALSALLAALAQVPAPQPASPAPPLDLGAAAAPPLDVQVRLDRAHFSPGEIDGRGGANTRRALVAFQRARGLEPTGLADVATWQALDAEHVPTLVAYRITAEDVAGPFTELPEDMMEKAELPQLGYASAVEALAERFHCSPVLLRRMNPRASFDSAGGTIQVPNVRGGGLAEPVARVVVDANELAVTALGADGRVLARYPASVGSEHDPLPRGEWVVTGVAQEPPFNYNPELFWDADPTHAKAKLAPGPNNPVGLVWIALSREHYGIHGTPEPSRIGRGQSHGCIRLTNWDAVELGNAVAEGTPVLLFNDGPQRAAVP